MNELQIIESKLADILLDRNILPLGKLRLFIVSYIHKHDINYNILDVPYVPHILLNPSVLRLETKIERDLLSILIVDILYPQINLFTVVSTSAFGISMIESGIFTRKTKEDFKGIKKRITKIIMQHCLDEINLFIRNVDNLERYYLIKNNIHWHDIMNTKPIPQTIKESWHIKNGQPTQPSNKPKSSKCPLNRFFNWLLK